MATRTTYTHHGLTDPMLQRLSAMCAGRPHNHGGSLRALETRKLVRPIYHNHIVSPGKPWAYPVKRVHHWEPTEAGRAALTQARKEGW